MFFVRSANKKTENTTETEMTEIEVCWEHNWFFPLPDRVDLFVSWNNFSKPILLLFDPSKYISFDQFGLFTIDCNFFSFCVMNLKKDWKYSKQDYQHLTELITFFI